ncbi:MAG: A/G-specific adenine glycosylase [Anaerocolumna aminovalerica]|jgi:A/G-specific adenine glycosylase|uniref:A/G-specific adenine glycosylase n=1 Tax=Anaerocolumna aminovalerica TaxID=1527 RepID=UPI00209F9052|nr:A/G-specific adenine glycosylase [Anaerocolumna aminovalerica]MDU6265080.1 A/G-specific adenine glycosylase [Anaerocolumna aminovalerica]
MVQETDLCFDIQGDVKAIGVKMNYDYSETVEFLLDWYDLNRRFLPWREEPRPYYVWISEIMLQQTRVEAVKVYFERFISTLPSIKDLADCEEEKLLKLWEGLGYYNRVRNLQKTAKIIVEEYNGQMPADYDKLLQLPGIGPYTAGAIASISFQIPEPAVDGNVLRVMKRVAGSFDDITKAPVKKQMENDLREIIPRDRPGDFNQSIMDLGATVCIPNGKPLCDKCPIIHLCNGFQKGIQMLIPVKPEKKPRKIEDRTILLMEFDNRYAIRKRGSKGLLARLWELPGLDGKLSVMAVEEILLREGYRNFTIQPLGEGKHIFSHIEWHMVGYHIKFMEVPDEDILCNPDYVAEYNGYETVNTDCIWVSKERINKEFTLPSAFEIYKRFIV